jgi:hypothetical protein
MTVSPAPQRDVVAEDQIVSRVCARQVMPGRPIGLRQPALPENGSFLPQSRAIGSFIIRPSFLS